jgi:hypothetical protein
MCLSAYTLCFLPKGKRMREKILLTVSQNNFPFTRATRRQRNVAAGAFEFSQISSIMCVCVCVCVCVRARMCVCVQPTA